MNTLGLIINILLIGAIIATAIMYIATVIMCIVTIIATYKAKTKIEPSSKKEYKLEIIREDNRYWIYVDGVPINVFRSLEDARGDIDRVKEDLAQSKSVYKEIFTIEE